MKTQIKKIILGVSIILFTSGVAMATDASIRVTGNKSFELTLTNLNDNTQLVMKNKNGQVLYEETIANKESYYKAFNAELLTEGNYYVSVEDAVSVKTVLIALENGKLEFDPTKIVDRFKPMIMTKGSILYVNYFSPDKSPLAVSIYDKNGQLVYEEELTGKTTMGKGFDFSKSPKGEYTIALESNGKYYSHQVSFEQ